MEGVAHPPPGGGDAIGTLANTTTASGTKSTLDRLNATHGVHAMNATERPASSPSDVTASATPRPPPAALRGTVVLQLYGELGNHLASLAYYFAVRTIARREFDLDLSLHVRKQRSGKAASAARNVACLSSFRRLDFDECDWSDDVGGGTAKGKRCQQKIGDQGEALYDLMRTTNNHTIMRLAASLQLQHASSEGIRLALRDYVSMLTDNTVLEMYRQRGLGWTSDEPYPFLYNIDRIAAGDTLVNEFYNRGLQGYLAFSDDATTSSNECCALLPEEDEHVFHYRSFAHDLPKIHLAWGGAELVPEKSAALLSDGGLRPGTKVALLTGRSSPERVAAYEEAFRAGSFAVRVIRGQSSIQDFCFLAHARAGLWATAQSSFAAWASLINGRLRRATLYGLNYSAREGRVAGREPANAELARVVRYPVFNVSDEDVW